MRRCAALVAALLVLAACTSSERSLPPPSSTSSTEPRSTTTRPDYSGVTLETVAGVVITSLPTEGGAVLQGVVTSAEGPVPEAIVRVEHLVGDASQISDVLTIEDGTWMLPGVPGGRYRIRAFKVPDLAMSSGTVLYVEDGERAEVRLSLEIFDGIDVRTGVTPGAPIVGRGVNLALRVTERRVDGDGIGQSVPQPDLDVEVRVTGWEPVDEDDDLVRTTDADGTALWEFRCPSVGPVTAVALLGPERVTVPLDVPACSPVPTTTTTTTSSTSPPTTAADG